MNSASFGGISSRHILTLFIGTLLLHAKGAFATTKTFDDSSPLLVYAPATAWSVVTDGLLAGGSAHSTTSSGASVSFSFSGQQVIVIGSADGAFEVTVDGTIYQESGGQAAGSTLFSVENLDQSTTHTIALTSSSDGQALAIDEVKVAFVTSLGIVPSLVSYSETASSTPFPALSNSAGSSTAPSASRFTTLTKTATIGSPLQTTSLSRSSLSSRSISAAPTAQVPLASSRSSSVSRRTGIIIGATLGTLASLAGVACTLVLLRRRWKKQVESGYWDQDTGKRSGPQGFIVGGTRHSFNPTQQGSSHEKAADVPTVMVTSSTESDGGWLGTLTRTGSWKRKFDRLRETRRFYGLGHSSSSQTLSATTAGQERGSLQFPSRKVFALSDPPSLGAPPPMQQVPSSFHRPISFFSFPRPPFKTQKTSSVVFAPPARPTTPPSRYAGGVASVTFSPIADPTTSSPTPQTPTRSLPYSKRATGMSPSTTHSPNGDSTLRHRNASHDFGEAPMPPSPSAFQRLVRSANNKKGSNVPNGSPKRAEEEIRPSYTSQDVYFSHAPVGSPRDSSSRILAALMDDDTDEEGEVEQFEQTSAQRRIIPASQDWRRTIASVSELNYGTSVDGDSEDETYDHIPRRRP